MRTLDPNSLSIDEVTIPRVIDRLGPDGPATGAFGKWHLGNRWNGAWNHPNIAGFDHYAGAPSNLKATNSFYRWTRVVNGKKRETRRYATTVNVDDTLAWIGEQRRPWFAWLAFNAAHWPWQVPPHELLPESDEPRPPAGEHCGAPCRRWMIEAMDTEIGRLLAGLGKQRSRTTIIFVGDNGTPAGVRPRGSPYPARPGMQHMKGTLYEGGLHVPLVVTGPAVREPGARSPALVHSTDLFATIIELVSGASLADLLPELEVDARSLLPLLTGNGTTVREFAYASLAGKSYAIRDHRFKLMRSEEGDRLFDLGDPRDRFLEVSNLMDSPRSELVEARYRALSSELGRLLASFEQSGPIPLADGAGAGRP